MMSGGCKWQPSLLALPAEPSRLLSDPREQARSERRADWEKEAKIDIRTVIMAKSKIGLCGERHRPRT